MILGETNLLHVRFFLVGQDMAYIHCSNPENGWNRRFVINLHRNEVFLHLWMAWCSYPQRLVKETSYTGFIWRSKLNNCCHSLISCSIIPFLLSFPDFNVVGFVTLVYLDKNFIVLCHTSMCSKTSCAKVVSVVDA